MLYRPSEAVTTDRTFSISAGLDASTVTPGNTAPEESVTVPAMPLACCAHACDDSAHANTTPIARISALSDLSMVAPLRSSQNFGQRLSRPDSELVKCDDGELAGGDDRQIAI